MPRACHTCLPANHYAPQEFPYTLNALFTALQGSYDAIFMQIDPGGATLGYSTYLGGSDSVTAPTDWPSIPPATSS